VNSSWDNAGIAECRREL